jgi:hypothetical protein
MLHLIPALILLIAQGCGRAECPAPGAVTGQVVHRATVDSAARARLLSLLGDPDRQARLCSAGIPVWKLAALAVLLEEPPSLTPPQQEDSPSVPRLWPPPDGPCDGFQVSQRSRDGPRS